VTAVVVPRALALAGGAFAVKFGRWTPLALGCVIGAAFAVGSLPFAEELSPD
jgi:hypothetical protein